ncbi:RWD domain-containing protein 1-like [Homarus americanus]|uniref:RWD domain-containing protein 1-like n=1 Tax=Homarus americanus TaxID=6706 RepID=A0A8J5JLG6_HOMAM|nr:RWD domain-containing protein 1-like [Homarus americanus]KAG7155349.1 RWD domain-containing protein 1-like [Homarus americanus]
MTDYKEEQNNEIEALESIYPDEFEILDVEPRHKFKISVKSEGSDPYDELKVEPAEIVLSFEYTPTYPDEPPIMEVIPVENIEEEELSDLREQLEAQCEENVGMVMVFTLVSYTVEWLTTHMETLARTAKDEFEREKKELEEAERKKFEGTRVTVETFLVWKAKFDVELAALRTEKEKEEEKNKKLTGRELFQTDQTLNESDLSFLGDGEGEVTVDESLFQDLDDLDLDEEDDEDFVPDVDEGLSD